jgi:hypothetical protein
MTHDTWEGYRYTVGGIGDGSVMLLNPDKDGKICIRVISDGPSGVTVQFFRDPKEIPDFVRREFFAKAEEELTRRSYDKQREYCAEMEANRTRARAVLSSFYSHHAP